MQPIVPAVTLPSKSERMENMRKMGSRRILEMVFSAKKTDPLLEMPSYPLSGYESPRVERVSQGKPTLQTPRLKMQKSGAWSETTQKTDNCMSPRLARSITENTGEIKKNRCWISISLYLGSTKEVGRREVENAIQYAFQNKAYLIGIDICRKYGFWECLITQCIRYDYQGGYEYLTEEMNWQYLLNWLLNQNLEEQNLIHLFRRFPPDCWIREEESWIELVLSATSNGSLDLVEYIITTAKKYLGDDMPLEKIESIIEFSFWAKFSHKIDNRRLKKFLKFTFNLGISPRKINTNTTLYLYATSQPKYLQDECAPLLPFIECYDQGYSKKLLRASFLISALNLDISIPNIDTQALLLSNLNHLLRTLSKKIGAEMAKLMSNKIPDYIMQIITCHNSEKLCRLQSYSSDHVAAFLRFKDLLCIIEYGSKSLVKGQDGETYMRFFRMSKTDWSDERMKYTPSTVEEFGDLLQFMNTKKRRGNLVIPLKPCSQKELPTKIISRVLSASFIMLNLYRRLTSFHFEPDMHNSLEKSFTQGTTLFYFLAKRVHEDLCTGNIAETKKYHLNMEEFHSLGYDKQVLYECRKKIMEAPIIKV